MDRLTPSAKDRPQSSIWRACIKRLDLMDDDFWKAVREKERASSASRRTGALNIALLFGTAVVALTLILTPMLADSSKKASLPVLRRISIRSRQDRSPRAKAASVIRSAAASSRIRPARSASSRATASAPVAENAGHRPDGRGIRRLLSVSRSGWGHASLKAFLADNRGATAIEYGLVAALIGGALVSALGIFSGSLQDVFNVINNNLTVN